MKDIISHQKNPLSAVAKNTTQIMSAGEYLSLNTGVHSLSIGFKEALVSYPTL